MEQEICWRHVWRASSGAEPATSFTSGYDALWVGLVNSPLMAAVTTRQSDSTTPRGLFKITKSIGQLRSRPDKEAVRWATKSSQVQGG